MRSFSSKHPNMMETLKLFGVFLLLVSAIMMFLEVGTLFVGILEKRDAEFKDQRAQEGAMPLMRVVESGFWSDNDIPGDGDGFWRILVDEKTGVMYYAEYIYYGAKQGGPSITPLYNADGTLRIY